MIIDHDSPEHTDAEHTLSPKDRHTLEVGSAIARDVIEARGVYSVKRGRDLPAVFSARQRRRGRGILFTVHRPDGSTTWVVRPDAVDPENPGHKYEAACKARGGPGNVLDVHPYCRAWIDDLTVPVIVVEGIKKADAIISAAREATPGVAVVVVAISGVWNWISDGEPIPDMFGIPLESREVHICFDSDVFTNPNVADAARRLHEHVSERGAASVSLAYLPAGEDGAKVGADDYLAGDPRHSYADLAGCFKPFDAGDLAAERLRRSDQLRERLDDLWRTFWSSEWRGMGGHSRRDLYKVLCDLAADRGKLHPDGLRVEVSRRELCERVHISSRTLYEAIKALEEMGLIYRDNSGRKAKSVGAFMLRAKVNHKGTERGTGEDVTEPPQSLYAGGLPLRAPLDDVPRLRWSTPGCKAHRRTVPGTRRVRDTRIPARAPVKRLGKIRGAVVDALVAAGGSATLTQLCEILQRKRPRDLGRRVLPMLVEAGIIILDVDTVALAENWRERLAEIDDLEADRLRRRIWHNKDRENFRRYRERKRQRSYRREHQTPPTPHPANVGADGYISDLRSVEDATPSEPGESRNPTPEISDLAQTIREYLDLHPGAVRDHAGCELPGWLAGTFWCLDFYPGKVTAAECKAAISELGGERYLRDQLRVADALRQGAAV